MRSVSSDTDGAAIGGRNIRRSLKLYHAPQFKILTAEEAETQLRDKALPGDAGAGQLLKIATGLASRSRDDPHWCTEPTLTGSAFLKFRN